MEDHSQKITAALTPMLLSSPNPAKALMSLVGLMIDVKNGRQPSMYTDINYLDSKVYVPRDVVREPVAVDCLHLGRDCLDAVHKYLTGNSPQFRSVADDAVFAMKPDHFQKILNTEGFWHYYIAKQEARVHDFSEVVVSYQREYSSKGRTYERTADDH